MFVYYVILAVIALLAFSLTTRDGNQIATEVLRYFECERKGVDLDNPCDTSGYTSLLNLAITSISYILLGLFSSVNFIFVINIRELKQQLKTWFPHLFKILTERKATKFQVSDTPSTGSTTGMLPSTPHTTNEKKTFQ